MSNHVSFSQFSMWCNCPYQWYLNYVKQLRIQNDTIHTVFGTAMHETLQSYLTVLFNSTIKNANEIDLETMLLEKMKTLFLEKKDKNKEEFITKENLVEFCSDGYYIIEHFKKYRDEYFSKSQYELLGIEHPLDISLKNNVNFVGYIDVLIKDKISNKIKIIDFKTSTGGWREKAKKDPIKASQLLLYKKFYSEKYDCSIDMIEIEFIILKRKLIENCDFVQKRLQRVVPASGKPTIKKVSDSFNNFIEQCFNEDGSYKSDIEYNKAMEKTSCKYCVFLKNNCKGPNK